MTFTLPIILQMRKLPTLAAGPLERRGKRITVV
jgi:hypothetical protein